MSGLRDFIQQLEADGEFVHLKKKVRSGEEIYSIMWNLNDTNGVAFQAEIDGYDIPIVGNLFGTTRRWARACDFPLDLDTATYVERFMGLMEGKNKSGFADPTLVPDAPCKERKFFGGDVDLTGYPILKWHKLDGAPYILMGMCVTQDEKFGRNVGLYRISVIGKNIITVLTNANQDIGIHVSRARSQGRSSIPCAIVIGAEPAVYMAAVTKVDLKEDELRFASTFNQGRSIQIVKCDTNDICVPAGSEIVLEGDLRLEERVTEGPLGEWSGYFEEAMTTLTMKVNCITQRSKPIYVTTTAGHVHSEEEVMRVIQQNGTVNRQCKQRVTGFVRAGLPQAGRGYTAVVAINKRFPGWGKHAIAQVCSIPYIALTCNNVIIVDEDIDPHSSEDVMWALSTRVDPERDVILFPPAGVNPLNPAARSRPNQFSATTITDVAVCSKMGIDATIKKFGELEGHYRPAPIPVRPDPETFARIRAQWSEYGF
jgi:4-hydroxy-3-polyprenylbenzoate decarboxylase